MAFKMPYYCMMSDDELLHCENNQAFEDQMMPHSWQKASQWLFGGSNASV